jgi:hypothetical protein
MKATLACLLILAVVIISGCGQSAATPPSTSSQATGTVAAVAPEATMTDTPISAPATTTSAEPAPANYSSETSKPALTPEPELEPFPTNTATPTDSATPTTEPPPEETVSEVSQADIDAARQVVFDYWVAFNAYDLDGVLSYLEDSWRQENAESLESDMGRLKAFGTTLGVSEEAEPVVTADGKIEIRIKLKTPLGSRHVLYRLTKVSNDWKICYSKE